MNNERLCDHTLFMRSILVEEYQPDSGAGSRETHKLCQVNHITSHFPNNCHPFSVSHPISLLNSVKMTPPVQPCVRTLPRGDHPLAQFCLYCFPQGSPPCNVTRCPLPVISVCVLHPRPPPAVFLRHNPVPDAILVRPLSVQLWWLLPQHGDRAEPGEDRHGAHLLPLLHERHVPRRPPRLL